MVVSGTRKSAAAGGGQGGLKKKGKYKGGKHRKNPQVIKKTKNGGFIGTASSAGGKSGGH